MLNMIRGMNYVTAKAEIHNIEGYKVFPIHNLKTDNQIGFVVEDKKMMFNGSALYHVFASNGYEIVMVKGDDLDRILENNLNAYL